MELDVSWKQTARGRHSSDTYPPAHSVFLPEPSLKCSSSLTRQKITRHQIAASITHQRSSRSHLDHNLQPSQPATGRCHRAADQCLCGDISYSLGTQGWFGFPQTRVGINGIYRTLDEFSPRYCPGTIDNAFGFPECDPTIEEEEGNEWEVRTYLHFVL